jgi:hypothetical protein
MIKMKRMTEEEAWALDEEISNDETIEFGPNGTGFLSMRDARLMGLNDLSVKYLMTKACNLSCLPPVKAPGKS